MSDEPTKPLPFAYDDGGSRAASLRGADVSSMELESLRFSKDFLEDWNDVLGQMRCTAPKTTRWQAYAVMQMKHRGTLTGGKTLDPDGRTLAEWGVHREGVHNLMRLIVTKPKGGVQ